MNKVKGLIGAGILTLTSLSGCQAKYLEGTVVKESGTVLNLVESPKPFLFGNESVKFGNPNYILTIKTNGGKYIVDLREINSYKNKTLAALAEAIEVGDRVRFRTNDINGISYFSRDRIGTIPTPSLEVLGK